MVQHLLKGQRCKLGRRELDRIVAATGGWLFSCCFVAMSHLLKGQRCKLGGRELERIVAATGGWLFSCCFVAMSHLLQGQRCKLGGRELDRIVAATGGWAGACWIQLRFLLVQNVGSNPSSLYAAGAGTGGCRRCPFTALPTCS